MRANFATVMGWIGLSEGGYVNHPSDPGGPTDRGITQRTFDAWNKRNGYPLRPVKGIAKETAETILAAQYFAPIRFDDLPSGLDYAMADFAVNSGVAKAAKTLQKILRVTQDGIVGEHTLAALIGEDVQEIIVKLCQARMSFLRRLSTWTTFGKGWKARVMGRVDGAQADDIGVIDRAVRLARGAERIPAPTVTAPGKTPATLGLADLILGILTWLTKGRRA